jgi:competence protein ComGC
MDWMQEIRQHKYFPLAIMALIVIVVISILRGRSY